MLLAVDVGNTQTVVGLFQEKDLVEHYRVSTHREFTADEYMVMIQDLFKINEFSLENIQALVISSVVPTCTKALSYLAEKKLSKDLLIVGPGIKTGISILYDNPLEIGSDRIVNSVAAYNIYGGPVVIVDFGTATTFDVVTEKGEYLGGAIAPGIEVSAEALFEKAAMLSKIELKPAKHVIGKNTQESLRSGIINGTAGLIDVLIAKIWDELGTKTKVISTGGQAELIEQICQTEMTVDSLLTLKGLQIVYMLNTNSGQ